jgi:hypothetical protein
MKKNVLIIIGIVIIIAIALVIASRFYPPPEKSELSGTLAKAEKFRKGQFTAKDILLRQEILTDTSAIRTSLEQLLEYSWFIAQKKLLIDTNWIAQLERSGVTTENDRIIKLLKDHSEYLKNNLVYLVNTTDYLANALHGARLDPSQDFGFNLVNIVRFSAELSKSDTVLDKALQLVYKKITTSKEASLSKKELETIKSLYDELLLENLFIGIKTGNRKKVDQCLNSTLQSALTGTFIITSSSSLKVLDSAYDNLKAVASIAGITATPQNQYLSSDYLSSVLKSASYLNIGAGYASNILSLNNNGLNVILGNQHSSIKASILNSPLSTVLNLNSGIDAVLKANMLGIFGLRSQGIFNKEVLNNITFL